jgi:DNA-binding NtrC family response regulator
MINGTMNTEKKEACILIVNANRDFTLLLGLLLEQMEFNNLMFAADYFEAVEKIATESVDLFILDTDLGEGRQGIKLAEEIRNKGLETPIIYITPNYTDEYFNSVHHTRPSSFLNQELSYLKLRQAVELALLHSNSAAKQGKRTKAKARHIPHQQLFVKNGDVSKAVPT